MYLFGGLKGEGKTDDEERGDKNEEEEEACEPHRDDLDFVASVKKSWFYYHE